MFSSPQSISKATVVEATLFKSTFGVRDDIYVLMFIGIFLTISRDVYKKGIVQLVPQKGIQKAADVLEELGENLKKWLKRKFFAILVVFILTAADLAIIHIKMWLVLAILAGLLNFTPIINDFGAGVIYKK